MIPGVNDAPGQVEELVEAVGEAGAESIGGVGLHLRGEVREIWFDWLRQYRPDLVPRYEELYRRGAYMPADERERLAARARGGQPPAAVHGRARHAEGDRSRARADRARARRASSEVSARLDESGRRGRSTLRNR